MLSGEIRVGGQVWLTLCHIDINYFFNLLASNAAGCMAAWALTISHMHCHNIMYTVFYRSLDTLLVNYCSFKCPWSKQLASVLASYLL